METVLFSSDKKDDLRLLMDLAKKIGIKTKSLSREEIEEIGLALAIKTGRTGAFIDDQDFIKKLTRRAK